MTFRPLGFVLGTFSESIVCQGRGFSSIIFTTRTV